jgi:DNA polymerase-3 subunit alpha
MARSGIPRGTAKAIFDDIEYFARYGFNKSHAADYAVLTCQTAYLKARYPVEYMTALLTVERNNTDKVSQFIDECRHLGIEVLPPDVNASGLGFNIEEKTDGSPKIRFGMGAIKNVGEGPLEAILKARRARGPFRDLDDFCRRVDLRQVNRRALESMIQVGTLRRFGKRSQLLPIVDRIIGLSANLHRARDAGQLSMFGDATGIRLTAQDTILPTADEVLDIPRKKVLDWEKELVGVYVSEHPLTRVLTRLGDVLSGSVGTLSEEKSGQQVTIAGMVQRVYRHTTRKGNEMAFVTLEDMQGSCDIVVFPGVWRETKDVWQPEHIVVVNGRVDTSRRDEPSLLCSWVKRPEDLTVASAPSATGGSAPAQSVPPPEPIPPPERAARRVKQRAQPVEPSATSRQTVCVTLRRTDEQAKDKQKLREIHDLLTAYDGNDGFVIRLTDGSSGGVELRFPNKATGNCPELRRELAALVGQDAVQVLEEAF